MNDDVLITASGKWPSILMSIGVSELAVSGKHSPCPICEGKDRFRMIESAGKAKWICNQCGSGDGMNLACEVLKLPFKDAVEKIRPLIPGASYQVAPKKPDAANIKRRTTELMNLWRSADQFGIAKDYLMRRGLPAAAIDRADIRGVVTSLYEEGRSTQTPAMLARVSTPMKRVACLHRTYIFEDSTKKKLSQTTREWTGGAIRLFQPDHTQMIVCEGIETALAARWMWHRKHGSKLPAWATVSANGMKNFAPPKNVTHLLIFGDNDLSYTGQKVAFDLANRMVVRNKIKADVFIPPAAGDDWLDVLNRLQS